MSHHKLQGHALIGPKGREMLLSRLSSGLFTRGALSRLGVEVHERLKLRLAGFHRRL